MKDILFLFATPETWERNWHKVLSEKFGIWSQGRYTSNTFTSQLAKREQNGFEDEVKITAADT